MLIKEKYTTTTTTILPYEYYTVCKYQEHQLTKQTNHARNQHEENNCGPIRVCPNYLASSELDAMPLRQHEHTENAASSRQALAPKASSLHKRKSHKLLLTVHVKNRSPPLRRPCGTSSREPRLLNHPTTVSSQKSNANTQVRPTEEGRGNKQTKKANTAIVVTAALFLPGVILYTSTCHCRSQTRAKQQHTDTGKSRRIIPLAQKRPHRGANL